MADQLRHRRQQGSSLTAAKDGVDGETYRVQGDEECFKVLTSAPPPWHSVLMIVAFVGLYVWTLPAVDVIDEIANRATIANSLSGLGARQIAVVRSVFACIIWGTSIACMVGNGWLVFPPYVNDSKLKRKVPLRLKGIRTMWPFTAWSWNLLGVWFSLSAYIAWNDQVPPTWALRLAVVSWEISAPCTILVAAVVRYVLWPAALRNDPPVHALGSLRNILMHNVNVLMAVTECFLLSGMPVRWSDCSLAPLWGCVYVVFTWSISLSWASKEHGPQFLYFFFDTTVPGFTPSLALMVLLLVLLAVYALFCSVEQLTHILGGGLAARIGLGGLLCFGVMRFKD